MDQLPPAAAEGSARLQKLDIREGEEVNKSRKCRNCRLPLYPSEGVEQLCPWCYDKKETLICEAYDELQDALLLSLQDASCSVAGQ